MSDSILNMIDGALTIITLNRPDKLNAFDDDMHHAFHTALTNASENSACRAVLITGAGRGFCAGQDLGGRDPLKSDSPDLGDTLRNFYNPNIRLIWSMAKPVIAAVNGVAAGAGANIALACDIVIAAETARFIQSFAKVGLIPDAGGSWILTKLVGPARAKLLTMTALPLTAADAVSWGLISRVVADDALMAEATKIAKSLASGPTIGLALTKQAINAALENDAHSQLDLEAELQSIAGKSADYREGVSAFLEKRTARFSGS